MDYVKEKDVMGSVMVPGDAYYGPQTQRAVENFPISGLTAPPVFIHSLALIKKCAVLINRDLGVLKSKIADAVVVAAQEVIDGQFDDQFVVDVFQTGSGTSTNMNMNEVIASRANEIITGVKVGKFPVHPNDHVNAGQSSNDVIPSALNIAATTAVSESLLPALGKLQKALSVKASEFAGVKKIGRTHLQDAVPMTLGQEFSAYARQIENGADRIKSVKGRLLELPLGGTAVGTGINSHPDFSKKIILSLIDSTNIPFRTAGNYFEAQSAQDSSVEMSGALKTIAVALYKIANDIRWLASGPRCGIGEINLPALQPGSSIMPGKVNPVVPEMVMQTAVQVMGNDTVITMGGKAGNFQLNTMLPVIAYNLLQSITILSNAMNVFADKCIAGVTANREKCALNIEQSLSLAAVLVPRIGYDKASEIAREAYETGETIRQTALRRKVIDESDWDSLF